MTVRRDRGCWRVCVRGAVLASLSLAVPVVEPALAQTYGPFKKEDVAMIPSANARTWLRDGTVIRIVAEEELSE